YPCWALIAFPAATLLGAIIGSHFTQPDWIGFLNLASFFIGLLIALALQLKLAPFLAIITIFGFTHGFANAESDLRGSDFVLYVCGVAAARSEERRVGKECRARGWPSR